MATVDPITGAKTAWEIAAAIQHYLRENDALADQDAMVALFDEADRMIKVARDEGVVVGEDMTALEDAYNEYVIGFV